MGAGDSNNLALFVSRYPSEMFLRKPRLRLHGGSMSDKQSVHQSLASFLDRKLGGEIEPHPFFYFEPWDVKERKEWVKEQAKKDGINLYEGELLKHLGGDPHQFQTGYLLSQARMRTLLAASRVGKTVATNIELGIMVSGEKPISMRFEKGHKTNVKRLITPENIIRFGRLDSRSGEFIDNNVDAKRAEGWEEWDCGFIEGVGVYPDDKICKAGQVCWIGTTHQALLEYWWPNLTNRDRCLFPYDFIDRRSGNDGYMKSEWSVYCVRGTRITIISYESGFRKYEATEVHSCVFDEESPDQACVTAAINHCKYFSMAMTPYMGMTYTKRLIFDSKKNKDDNQVFHATSYDSPYLTTDTINHRRSLMQPYEIGARIWGLHTEASGQPYFDRHKINTWIRRLDNDYKLAKFYPAEEYDGIITNKSRSKPGIMDVEIKMHDAGELNRQDVWKIYEPLEEGVAYYLMADSAEGSDIPDESADVLAAMVMRPPDQDEKFPQIVATLRSTLRTHVFARVVLYAVRYWNNALLCAEGPIRGSFNALFYAENKDYPYWFKQTSIRDSTRKVRTIKGFDTNVATRGAIFDGIREVLDENTIEEMTEIRDEDLLVELAACIVAKKNGKTRPDHDKRSSLDSAICYGQGIYVWKNYTSQIKCRTTAKKRGAGFLESYFKKDVDNNGNPVYLGEYVTQLR